MIGAGREPLESNAGDDSARAWATELDSAASERASIGLADDVDPRSKYVALFIDEAEAALDQWNETLLACHAGGSTAALDSLCLAAHRIKGSASCIGLHRCAKVAHRVEDLLAASRGAHVQLDPPTVDILLRCGDVLRDYLEALRCGRHDDFEMESTLAGLTHGATSATAGGRDEQVAERAVPSACDAPADIDFDDGTRERIVALAPAGAAGFVVLVRFAAGLPLAALKVQLIADKLSRLGDLFYREPASDTLDEAAPVGMSVFGVATSASQSIVHAHVAIGGTTSVELFSFDRRTAADEPAGERLGRPALHHAADAQDTAVRERDAVDSNDSAAPANQPAALREAAGLRAATVRVEVEHLDRLASFGARLLGHRDRLEALRALLAGSVPHAPESSVASIDLSDAIGDVTRMADELNALVAAVRMTSIGALFERFHRVLRDLERSSGKSIELAVRGQDTMLHKHIVEVLSEPLIHMVRNAAAHGIEAPPVRRARGKPERGTITLEAARHGQEIVVRLSDDGDGIDVERIKAQGLESGLLSPDEAARLGRRGALELIWRHGFSTADRVTELAGRGIGMAIVRQKVEGVGGSIAVDSTAGQGTTFTVRLPVELAGTP